MRKPNDDDLDDDVEPTPIWRRRNVQFTAVGVVVLLVFIFSRGGSQDKPKADPQKTADSFIGVVVPYQPAKADPVPIMAPPLPPAPPVKPPPVVEMSPPPLPPVTPPPLPNFRVGPQTVAQPPPSRPIMLSYAVTHTDGPVTKPGGAPAEPEQTGLNFKAGSIPGIKASAAIDDTYQLMPGLLPCVLDTAINSELTGPLMCHLPGPVYSPKGVPLMEAGTQIIGRYESVRNGQSRLMAVSTYAHTPNGIWVPMTDEPMADDLGRTGLPGAVDNHLVERFGAAIALNLTDSVLGIIQAQASKGGNTYLSVGNGGGGGIAGLAQQILQAQINIPPTITKNQGETIAIFLSKPISFADSYRIRSVRQ